VSAVLEGGAVRMDPPEVCVAPIAPSAAIGKMLRTVTAGARGYANKARFTSATLANDMFATRRSRCRRFLWCK